MGISEEEKEAIKFLTEQLDKEKNDDFCPVCLHNYLVIALNLIEKLKKEIKHQRQQRKFWRDNFYKQQKEIEELKFDNHMVGKWNEYLDKDCISKNRMKEIIKKYIDIEEALNYTNQEIYGEDLKNMILELLGENNG